MERFEPILIFADEIEAGILDAELTARGIPHIVRSYVDSALDGVYHAQKGWGRLDAPPDMREQILAVHRELGAVEASTDADVEAAEAAAAREAEAAASASTAPTAPEEKESEERRPPASAGSTLLVMGILFSALLFAFSLAGLLMGDARPWPRLSTSEFAMLAFVTGIMTLCLFGLYERRTRRARRSRDSGDAHSKDHRRDYR
jgi:hypothetical protein